MSAHVSLARKWRPQRFEDVIGQPGVVQTLRNAILSGRLAQAFIFAGPRGVGKTTTARILARALNCVNGPTPEPCGVCDACREIAESGDMDVLEIDGATYTGVDAVREVIVEPLGIAPMRDRFKIFIIDEVHRLSKQAFDALLKSIEEPPPYVKFLMATTDLHAVPATIQSRSQIFDLRTLPFAVIREQLRAVTASERVTIEDAALALVARSAEGSMRDALGALDQVLAFTADRVTAADASAVLGLIGRDLQLDVLEVVAREDAAAAFDVAARVVDAGADLRVACRELARLVRDVLVVKIDPSRAADPEIADEGSRERIEALARVFSREDLMRSFDLLSRAEFDVRTSSQPRHQFEMALVKWIHLRKLTPIEEVIAQVGGGARTGPPAPAARPSGPPSSPPRTTQPVGTPQPSASSKPAPASPASGTGAAPIAPADRKTAFLSAVREKQKIFYGMVVMQATEIAFDADVVVFTFTPQHKSLRSELERKRGMLEEIAQQIAGHRMTIVARESAPAPAAADAPAAAREKDLRERAKADPAVQTVLDVFGGEVENVEEIS